MPSRKLSFATLSQEQIAFLNRCEGMQRKEAAMAFNKEFKCEVPLGTIKGWLLKLDVSASGTGRFDGSQLPWAKGLTGDKFWERYSEESKKRMLDAPREANRTARIGDVRIKAGEPYICISTDPTKPFHQRRKPLRRVVWEKHHGDIPNDCMVIHLNGNRLDCRIENLAMIPKSFRPTVLRYLKSNDPELTKAAIKICELNEEIRMKRSEL